MEKWESPGLRWMMISVTVVMVVMNQGLAHAQTLGKIWSLGYCLPPCTILVTHVFASVIVLRFFCVGGGHYLLSSRINDGICDCCDGSDEWKKLTVRADVLQKHNFNIKYVPCGNACWPLLYATSMFIAGVLGFQSVGMIEKAGGAKQGCPHWPRA